MIPQRDGVISRPRHHLGFDADQRRLEKKAPAFVALRTLGLLMAQFASAGWDASG